MSKCLFKPLVFLFLFSACFFLEYWKRKEVTLAYHWDVLEYEEEVVRLFSSWILKSVDIMRKVAVRCSRIVCRFCVFCRFNWSLKIQLVGFHAASRSEKIWSQDNFSISTHCKIQSLRPVARTFPIVTFRIV